MVNDHCRTLPIMHQVGGGRRHTDTKCQREFVMVLEDTFERSLADDKVGKGWESPARFY